MGGYACKIMTGRGPHGGELVDVTSQQSSAAQKGSTAQQAARAGGAGAAALRAGPADGAGCGGWSEGFELRGRTARIEALLAEQEGLRESYAALVPDVLSYRAFWARAPGMLLY